MQLRGAASRSRFGDVRPKPAHTRNVCATNRARFQRDRRTTRIQPRHHIAASRHPHPHRLQLECYVKAAVYFLEDAKPDKRTQLSREGAG